MTPDSTTSHPELPATPASARHVPAIVDPKDPPVTTAAASPAATTRILLDTTDTKYTLLDGAWWPRSNDPYVELPALVEAIDDFRGPVKRLILHAGDWAEQPTKLQAAGRVIKLGYFRSQPAALLTVICEHQARVDLMIVPLDTPDEAAEAAMKLAATAGNRVHAQDILKTIAG
ncbi:MAG: hypothetical protein QOH84_4826 [Kribbellaceae bacterium]|nr:hypothetical protein [Kribbellaceae bacterium]